MATPNTNPPQQKSAHVNFGMLLLRSPTQPAAGLDEPMTIITTGVGRSGTSMMAAVLTMLGVPMGPHKNLPVYEDEEFVSALLYFDYARVARLIEARNTQNQRWGFKFPSLQNHLLPPQIKRFRNPRLIVVMRDPVAVATRANLSDPELQGEATAFFNVSQQAYDMMHFVHKAECPTLLLSYEKCIVFPDHAVDAVAAFCGLKVDSQSKSKAIAAITPNNSGYIKLFHQDYRGHFDGIRNGKAFGWCRSNHSEEPVVVELTADGGVLASCRADAFRQDLHRAGVGTGRYSFEMDVSGLQLSDGAVLRVQTQGGGFVLEGGGAFKNLRRP
jgi:hypothetical protein